MGRKAGIRNQYSYAIIKLMSNLDKIFQAYDIRGVYPEEIDEEVAYKIGRAVAKFLKTKEIIIGRDSRISSDNLFKVLSEGVRDEGVGVIDIGLATTPMLYFSIVKWGIKGGVMITASHNPPQYNGIKVMARDGVELPREKETKIEDIFLHYNLLSIDLSLIHI